MHAKLDEENRLVCFITEDLSDVDPETRVALLEQFPVEVSNPEIILDTPSMTDRDFVVEDGVARFDPLPESIEQMKENTRNESIPDRMDEADDALSAMYEIMLYEQDIIDSQDEALCALYETMIGGE